MALGKAKKYCENNKKVLKNKARDKYRYLFKEEKNIKRKYGRNRYHKLSKEKTQKLKEYYKKYREAKMSQSVIDIFYGFKSIWYDLVMQY